ncbi:MAG: riboflavin synthase [Candidatus Humimicrobiaceae bacterium]
MFTGMIKEVGKLNKISRVNTGLEIETGSLLLTKDMKNGDSIAVNGCCLTVSSFIAGKSFKADVSFSTLKSTTLGLLKSGAYLNLEDAVKFNDKLGGHLVSGHIDCAGKIVRISKEGDFYRFEIKIPKDIIAFAAPKGSLSVDGISLTISDSLNAVISFAIIPFTFESTNLKYKKQGEAVNLEVDLMARYILNMAKYGSPMSGGSFSGVGDYMNILNMHKLNSEIQNKKNADSDLKEKLEKYGFKK